MAYRRRQGITRASTFKEEIHQSLDHDHSSSSSSSLAAQAIRASAAHNSSISSARGARPSSSEAQRSKSFAAYEGRSSTNESGSGFWGVLARKAKAILEDEEIAQSHQHELSASAAATTRFCSLNTSTQFHQPYQSSDNNKMVENPRIRKGLDAITSSLNQLGDTFEKAFEGGRMMVENRTADIIQETRKLQIKRNGIYSDASHQAPVNRPWHQTQPAQPQIENHETQLKASRDVAMATAAKAKLLLRELKTVKADFAFAKERTAQLEEENKVLRENREKGVHRADDDLIRLQLETLLAEKARLANENSIYARENRFLREIVEYHQLTMQDVVYLDESTEEVTEVYPISSPGITKFLSVSPPSPVSPPLLPYNIPSAEDASKMDEASPVPTEPEENGDSPFPTQPEENGDSPAPTQPEENGDASKTEVQTSSIPSDSQEENTRRPTPAIST